MGVPFWMQLAKAMVSAPRFTSSRTRSSAFFPGQPPQLMNPTISTCSSPANAPVLSLTARKSAVPGQYSSVCKQRMIPPFIKNPPLSHTLSICRCFGKRPRPKGTGTFLFVPLRSQQTLGQPINRSGRRERRRRRTSAGTPAGKRRTCWDRGCTRWRS